MTFKEQTSALLCDAKLILGELEQVALTWERRYNYENSRLQEFKSLDALFSTAETKKAVRKAERRKERYGRICLKVYDKIDAYRYMVNTIQRTYDAI